MSRRLPPRQEALSFLAKARCSFAVIRHCKAVAALAVKMAEACQRKGLKVDVQLVEIGALLHDVGRSRTHSVNHVVAGVEIARSLGLPGSVISIIECHAGSGISKDEARRLGWPARNYIPQTLEAKIVTYADKLIEGSKKVQIEQVLEKFVKDNLPPSSIHRIKQLHEEFSSLIGDSNGDDHTS